MEMLMHSDEQELAMADELFAHGRFEEALTVYSDTSHICRASLMRGLCFLYRHKIPFSKNDDPLGIVPKECDYALFFTKNEEKDLFISADGKFSENLIYTPTTTDFNENLHQAYLHNTAESLSYFRSQSHASVNPECEVHLYSAMAECHFRLGQYKEAIDTYMSLCHIIRGFAEEETRYYQMYIDMQYKLGVCHVMCGRNWCHNSFEACKVRCNTLQNKELSPAVLRTELPQACSNCWNIGSNYTSWMCF